MIRVPRGGTRPGRWRGPGGAAWPRWTLLILLAVLGAACVQPAVVRDGVPMSADDAARADIAEARGLIESRRFADARATLEVLLRDMPRSRRADEALFLLGYAHELEGDGERAVLTWRRMLEAHPRSRFGPQARLRGANVYQRLGRADLARPMLERAAFERAPAELRVEMFRKLAELSRLEGDWAATVRALAFARRDAETPEAVAEIDFELSELVSDRLRDAELEPLIGGLPRGPVRDRVGLELAGRQIARGEYDVALDTLDRLPSRLREVDDTRRETLRGQAMRGARTEVYPVGLLLPLSGPFAPFGRAALRGVLEGLELFAEVPGRYRVMVRDTEGDPELAPRLVRELAAGGARVILGPMRSTVAAAAGVQAQRERVPLLAFTNREDVPQLGDYVFRVGTAPVEQVGVLVDHARESLGARRFAVMYPRDDYGRRYKEAYWDAVEARGGTIVGVEGYEPGSVDLQSEIRKLVGLEYLTPAEREGVRERDRLRKRPQDNRERLESGEFDGLPPYVDFDVLFIPDAAENVGLILPQLRFYDVRGVQFLGPSDWNRAKLLEIAGREADGALFVDAFHGQSTDEDVQSFVSRFVAKYGEAPDAPAAQGYDVARLLRQVVEERGEVSSRAMRDGLVRRSRFSGVTGLTAFDDSGAPIRELKLLTVRRGEILAVDASR